jgi:hypothetical protein
MCRSGPTLGLRVSAKDARKAAFPDLLVVRVPADVSSLPAAKEIPKKAHEGISS